MYCQEAGIEFKDLAAIAFYDKPFIKFERLIETYHAFAPVRLTSFFLCTRMDKGKTVREKDAER